MIPGLRQIFTRGRWRWGLVAMLALSLLLSACTGQRDTVSSLELEAQGIDKSLICPVCPGETIDQSQVPLAGQMRAQVREMLAQGKTRGEIQEFFVERYGPSVLAAPPQQGGNLVAWVVPPVAFLAGLVVLALVLRELRRRRSPEEETLEEEPGLDPYLSRVDAELARDLGEPSPPPPKPAHDAQ